MLPVSQLPFTTHNVVFDQTQAQWVDGEVADGGRATFFFPDGSLLEGRWQNDGLHDATFVPRQPPSLLPSRRQTTATTTAANPNGGHADAQPQPAGKLFSFDVSTEERISCVPSHRKCQCEKKSVSVRCCFLRDGMAICGWWLRRAPCVYVCFLSTQVFASTSRPLRNGNSVCCNFERVAGRACWGRPLCKGR